MDLATMSCLELSGLSCDELDDVTCAIPEGGEYSRPSGTQPPDSYSWDFGTAFTIRQ